MYDEINQVIAKSIQSIEIIIAGKREIGKKPGRGELKNGLQVSQIFDRRIAQNGNLIIKLERDFEGIRINKDGNKGNNCY